MFFIKASAFVAWALLIIGGLRAGIGFIVASASDSAEARIALSRRYLGSATTGEAIDQGLTWVAAGLVLGLLVTIARNTYPK